MGLVAGFFIAVAACYVGLGSVTASDDWGYNRQGIGAQNPYSWAWTYPRCGGFSQSPINVDGWFTLPTAPFTFNNYNNVEALEMENNGHTVQVNVKGRRPCVSGGSLGATYYLDQFHFHWFHNNGAGTEHLVNGLGEPLEMHLVHRRSDFPTIKAALHDPTGLAVLAVSFCLSPHDNPKLNNVIWKLRSVKEPGNKVDVDRFPLTDLLPYDARTYYRYYGSLTTPPCNEAIVWTLFQQCVPISPAQMDAFRQLRGNHGPISGNIRPIQPRNGRIVNLLVSY